MGMFATPNYGISGTIAFLVLIVWVFVLLIVMTGIVVGVKMWKRPSSIISKTIGFVLLLISGLIPCSCYLGPSLLIRLAYGNYPIGHDADDKIKIGMSKDEVKAILGTPHERVGNEWHYWRDSFGISVFIVHFNAQDRVTITTYF